MTLTRSRAGHAVLDDLALPHVRPNGSTPERPRLPEADVIETDAEVLVVLDVPGVRAEEIELTMEQRTLTVTGAQTPPQVEGEEQYRWLVAERRYGRFTRSFLLPPDLDADAIRADLDQGVLRVRIPKRSSARRRRIEVRSSNAEQTPRD